MIFFIVNIIINVIIYIYWTDASLPYTLCQKIVKEKNLISFCFRSNPNVCTIDNCIVLYKLIWNKYV